MGAIIAVGLVMEFVGFQLAMFAFVAFVLTALGWRGWGLTVVLSAVLSFGVYHAFTRWLDVTLPQASIEILRSWGSRKERPAVSLQQSAKGERRSDSARVPDGDS